LWSWGNNFAGALGNSSALSVSSPIQIGSDTTWTNVFAGYGVSFATKSDGTLWAWGKTTVGQLGIGAYGANISSPVQVGALTDWGGVKLVTGRLTVTAIKSNGTLWAWGGGASGCLGDGTIVSKSSPIQIGALSDWSLLGGGSQHRHAVRSNGTLWSWGYNNYGQLGLGDTTNRSSPVQVGALTNWLGNLNSNLGKAPSSASFAAVKQDGTLWAVGKNNYGQLGDGTTVNKSSPVQIGSLTNWLSLSQQNIGLSFRATVALKSNGTLWSWGSAYSGVLGLGTAIDYSSPVQIGTSSSWTATVSGYLFAFALVK
jgi:alpha-tubulin suppressor-like RCC1 family protein